MIIDHHPLAAARRLPDHAFAEAQADVRDPVRPLPGVGREQVELRVPQPHATPGRPHDSIARPTNNRRSAGRSSSRVISALIVRTASSCMRRSRSSRNSRAFSMATAA